MYIFMVPVSNCIYIHLSQQFIYSDGNKSVKAKQTT